MGSFPAVGSFRSQKRDVAVVAAALEPLMSKMVVERVRPRARWVVVGHRPWMWGRMDFETSAVDGVDDAADDGVVVVAVGELGGK